MVINEGTDFGSLKEDVLHNKTGLEGLAKEYSASITDANNRLNVVKENTSSKDSIWFDRVANGVNTLANSMMENLKAMDAEVTSGGLKTLCNILEQIAKILEICQKIKEHIEQLEEERAHYMQYIEYPGVAAYISKLDRYIAEYKSQLRDYCSTCNSYFSKLNQVKYGETFQVDPIDNYTFRDESDLNDKPSLTDSPVTQPPVTQPPVTQPPEEPEVPDETPKPSEEPEMPDETPKPSEEPEIPEESTIAWNNIKNNPENYYLEIPVGVTYYVDDDLEFFHSAFNGPDKHDNTTLSNSQEPIVLKWDPEKQEWFLNRPGARDIHISMEELENLDFYTSSPTTKYSNDTTATTLTNCLPSPSLLDQNIYPDIDLPLGLYSDTGRNYTKGLHFVYNEKYGFYVDANNPDNILTLDQIRSGKLHIREKVDPMSLVKEVS